MHEELFPFLLHVRRGQNPPLHYLLQYLTVNYPHYYVGVKEGRGGQSLLKRHGVHILYERGRI